MSGPVFAHTHAFLSRQVVLTVTQMIKLQVRSKPSNTDSRVLAGRLLRVNTLWVVCALPMLLNSVTANASEVESLRWLSGCWQLENAESGSGEQWMIPAGGLMLGMGRTLKDGVAVAYEFMRIESRQGWRVFVAQPQGGVATHFAEVEHSDFSVSFENLEHDFPKRIVYSRQGSRLLAVLSGENDSASSSIHIAMQQASCDVIQP